MFRVGAALAYSLWNTDLLSGGRFLEFSRKESIMLMIECRVTYNAGFFLCGFNDRGSIIT